MQVSKESRRDAADPNPDGSLDWVYAYTDYRFEDAGALLRFRLYADEPGSANLNLPQALRDLVPLAAGLLAEAAAYLHQHEKIVTIRAYHAGGLGYQPWADSVASALAHGQLEAGDAAQLLQVMASALGG